MLYVFLILLTNQKENSPNIIKAKTAIPSFKPISSPILTFPIFPLPLSVSHNGS